MVPSCQVLIRSVIPPWVCGLGAAWLCRWPVVFGVNQGEFAPDHALNCHNESSAEFPISPVIVAQNAT